LPERLGIELAPIGGGFATIQQGGKVGTYVVFMRGGPTGGHVVFGEVTSAGVTLFDAQLGRMFGCVVEAQNALGMTVGKAFLIKSVTVP
jgi:hypothetical protein